MISPSTLAACFVLDLWWGDPEWFRHPVRIIGNATGRLEALARRCVRSDRGELWAGAFLAAIISTSTFVLSRTLKQRLQSRHYTLGKAAEILLGWTTLALHDLLKEADAVIVAAENGNLTLARQTLSRIVGRDTADLDESEIARAVIETLAESTCDGVIAPMFYLLLGGAPLALMYKAVNTLDSMIGHRDDRYLYFGRAAARADDIANFLPARITATAIAVAGCLLPTGNGRRALETWRRDGSKHASPNAGRPEAAMAGALAVRLGGGNYYDGEFQAQPHLGVEFQSPTISDCRKAMFLCAGASLIAFAVALAVATWSER